MVDTKVIEISNQINHLVSKIERKYGNSTMKWPPNDLDVAKAKELGFKVWHETYKQRQIETKPDPARDARWRRIVDKANNPAFPFWKLPARTDCTWSVIIGLNTAYDGPLRPTFQYKALPIDNNSGKPIIYTLTQKALKYVLHMTQAKLRTMNYFAKRHGYYIVRGAFRWSHIKMGSVIVVEDIKPPIIKTSRSFVITCRNEEYYEGF